MRTNYFLLILFPVLLLAACQSPTPSIKNEHIQLTEQYFTAENSIFEQYPEPTKENTSNTSSVWELSDVDVSQIDPTRKLIAFSFDDAPARMLENILTVFASYNETNPDCKAFCTLFFNGYLFDNSSIHLLNTAVALGMELGNHTYSHLDLTTLDTQTLQWEIEETDKLLQKADKKPKHLLRPPYGKLNEEVKNTANVPILNWNIDTLDWTGKSADEIFNIVFSQKTDGSIVLMHDGYSNTVEAVKRLLPALKEANYQVVAISQLAKVNECTLKNGAVYIRARKPKDRN